MKVILIAAMDENRVIGNQGKLPWSIPEELKYFRDTTRGYPVIMGRKTFVSIGRTLPKRLNIILTRNQDFPKSEAYVVCHSMQDAIEVAKKDNPEKVFVIGGAKVYEEAFAFADQMNLSLVPGTHEGDTFFPRWGDEWVKTKEEDHGSFVLRIFEKNKNATQI